MSETEGNGISNGRRISDTITRFIRDVGFPIAVAAYLLLGLSPKIDKLTATVERLVIVMEMKK